MVTNEGSSYFFIIQVMQSLKYALQPAVQDISVTWDLPQGVSATILSPPITAIFQGQRSLIYAQLTGQVGSPPSHLMLKPHFDFIDDVWTVKY